MVLTSMLCVQLGLAVSVGLIDELGTSGAAWLRDSSPQIEREVALMAEASGLSVRNYFST
jgi:hypothetical protein